jgi:hypothetical protein
MLLSGIQCHDKRITLAVFLDSRYALSALRAGARMAKRAGMTAQYDTIPSWNSL